MAWLRSLDVSIEPGTSPISATTPVAVTAGAATAASLGLIRMRTQAHFRRDHFPVPEIEPSGWRVQISGCVEHPFELSLAELQTYPERELSVVLECAGHRRAELRPTPPGLPWQIGAVSEASWLGTSLSHVLEEAGVHDGRFVVLEGEDRGSFGGRSNVPFARALPIAKALDPDTLLAWQMNDEPLPAQHGAPVRAIVPGWYATDSVKWLTRIVVLDSPFDGPFETDAYRLSPAPDGSDGRLTSLGVHSLLTSIVDRQRIAAGEHIVRGIAWGGAGGVARVEISVDDAEWQEATLEQPSSPYGRAHWRFPWSAKSGLRTLAVRATDAAGNVQPTEPLWNKGGYGNASVQRVRVSVKTVAAPSCGRPPARARNHSRA